MPIPETCHLCPAPGRLVFVPETRRPLAPEGETVRLTPFWRRRIADGDVRMTAPRCSSPAPIATPSPAPCADCEDA